MLSAGRDQSTAFPAPAAVLNLRSRWLISAAIMTGDRFAHIGVAVNDLELARRSFGELFGYDLKSGPFDDPIQRVRVCFLATPDGQAPVIELIAPLGDDSPIKQLLARGGGAYHLCFEVADMQKALAEAKNKGCILVSGPVPAVAFQGRRIAWLYTAARQLVEFVERG
jgi:methylmalonyl-CoA/ethylmalonyl-CoA epimerase